MPDRSPACARLRVPRTFHAIRSFRSSFCWCMSLHQDRDILLGDTHRESRMRHFLVRQRHSACKVLKIDINICLYLFKENTLMHVSLDTMVDTLKAAAESSRLRI